MTIGVVRRIEIEVLAREVPVIESGESKGVDDGRVALQRHADAQAIGVDRRDEPALLQLRRLDLDDRRQRDHLPGAQLPLGRPPSQVLVKRALEPLDHDPNEVVSRRIARERICIRKEVAFQIGSVRIELGDQRRAIARLNERRRRAKALRLEDPGHLRDRQPLRERDRPQVHLTADELVNHLDRRERLIETVFAGLQVPIAAALPEGEPEGPPILDDPRVNEALGDHARLRPR